MNVNIQISRFEISAYFVKCVFLIIGFHMVKDCYNYI